MLYSSDGAFERVCGGAHWGCVGLGDFFFRLVAGLG